MADSSGTRFRAVIFDLFGTLVAAPTAMERSSAAAALAAAAELPVADVDAYLQTSWRTRHDGTVRTVSELSAHLLTEVGGSAANTTPVAATWRRLASRRLVADETVIGTLDTLSSAGLALGLLSDASAEIADAWVSSDLSSRFGSSVFSCTAAAVKPDESLYLRALSSLGVAASTALYVGDGGGDELQGAEHLRLTAVRVQRRGGDSVLSFGNHDGWNGTTLPDVEAVPTWIGAQR